MIPAGGSFPPGNAPSREREPRLPCAMSAVSFPGKKGAVGKAGGVCLLFRRGRRGGAKAHLSFSGGGHLGGGGQSCGGEQRRSASALPHHKHTRGSNGAQSASKARAQRWRSGPPLLRRCGPGAANPAGALAAAATPPCPPARAPRASGPCASAGTARPRGRIARRRFQSAPSTCCCARLQYQTRSQPRPPAARGARAACALDHPLPSIR